MRDWQRNLYERLARLFDTLFVEAHPGAAPGSPLAVSFAVPPVDQSAWQDMCADDRDAFAAWAGDAYEDVLRRAHGIPTRDIDAKPHAAALVDEGIDPKARTALLRLIAWDARHMYTPTAFWLIRNAQIADDRDFLSALGASLQMNARYAGRHSREQRLLNRVLAQFTFGGRRSFDDPEYRKRVRRALFDIYFEVEVPGEDPGWIVLDGDKPFNRHLRRLGLLDKEP